VRIRLVEEAIVERDRLLVRGFGARNVAGRLGGLGDVAVEPGDVRIDRCTLLAPERDGRIRAFKPFAEAARVDQLVRFAYQQA
jgi:hypothetical protein